MLQGGRQSQVAEKLANIWGSVYGGSSPLQQLTSGRWTGGDPTQFGETDVKVGLKEEILAVVGQLRLKNTLPRKVLQLNSVHFRAGIGKKRMMYSPLSWYEK